MNKTRSTRSLSLPALLALSLFGGSALAAEGRFAFDNEAVVAVELATRSGAWDAPPPQRLEAGGGGEASLAFPDRGVIVNQASYREADGRRGCSFRVQTEPGPVLCRVVVVPQPAGGASCHYRFEAQDSATCGFTLVFSLSGF